ncbi:MAG: triphosphoribosyl-dephospho-CoA synthase [Chloroflexi bacterium]|nr:triphosphoribosyl-dephospho-CoA synthase [Chloroflexota bacterium]
MTSDACWSVQASEELAQAAQLACVLEVSAHKPGNVTAYHRFSDTGIEDFLLSALAIGPAFREVAGATVGETVLAAIQATRRVVRPNTNLGIVLLLVPPAKAATLPKPTALRDRLRAVLRDLTVEDARAVYAAIRLASPGGLGSVEANDVRSDPDITLLQAMRTAAGWDSVAREYATDFAVTFGLSTPTLAAALDRTPEVLDAIVQTFLTILAEVPDSLIARKAGLPAALDVAERARKVLDAGGVHTPAGRAAIRTLDARLRDPANRLNPGTTADLTTAAIFLHLLERGGRGPGGG